MEQERENFYRRLAEQEIEQDQIEEKASEIKQTTKKKTYDLFAESSDSEADEG